jgi:membrane-associated phospholipid phosphatase
MKRGQIYATNTNEDFYKKIFIKKEEEMNKVRRKLGFIFMGIVLAVSISILPVFGKGPDKDGMNHNPATTPGKQMNGPQTEPEAAMWKTFVLSSANQFRLPPPPDRDETKAELKSLRDLLATGDAASDAQVAFWDAGSPGYRWMQTAVNELTTRNISGPLGTRALSLLGVAIYDSTVAAWDSKYFYQRERPNEVDHEIQPILRDPQSPSYPSEHAVVAGAAEVILSYLYPDEAANFHNLADAAAQSRLFTGLQYPSDTAAGLQLGRAVGAAVVARAMQDGSDRVFTGSYPASPGVWGNPNPVAPLAGTWKPWVLTSGSEFRLPAPPAAFSPEETAQLAMIKNLVYTPAIFHIAWFWQPSFQFPWIDMVNQKIFEYHFDANPPRAALAYALTTVSQHDAAIACWDTKYTYLLPRPSQIDPTIIPLFPNPAHPSYPSGHACASGGAAAALSPLFPADASFFQAKALEAGTSTFYDGIHTMLDVQAGLTQGDEVGQTVANWAAGQIAAITNAGP